MRSLKKEEKKQSVCLKQILAKTHLVALLNAVHKAKDYLMYKGNYSPILKCMSGYINLTSGIAS